MEEKLLVQNTENANCPDHNDYALQDLYNRLNGTLAQVEQVVKKIEDSKKSGHESDQLILIQSTLRELITPMRRQLDPKNVKQAPLTKLSKTSSRTSYSSLRRRKGKISSSSKKFESTGSIQTAVEKSQTYRVERQVELHEIMKLIQCQQAIDHVALSKMSLISLDLWERHLLNPKP
ncbi:hypothetical protein ACTXT7_000655 [Hymenolepis weldensis]